jgi:hypothetical protein
MHGRETQTTNELKEVIPKRLFINSAIPNVKTPRRKRIWFV